MMNLIFDTDLTNEIDDIFSLSYLLKSDLADFIKAITLAPYDPFWQDYDFDSVMERNISEANKIVSFVDTRKLELIAPGSKTFLKDCNESKKNIKAVERIVEISQKSKTIFLATGCLTNLALAIKEKPEIAKNISLVWLGGRNPFQKETKPEFNLRQDIEAAQIVFQLVEDITMIWSKEIAWNLRVPLEVITENLSNKHDLASYLLALYQNLEKVKLYKIKSLYDIAVPIYITNPEFFTMETISIKEITKDGTYLVGEGKPVKICTSIQTERILNQFFKIISTK